jgi:hypothetical protein
LRRYTSGFLPQSDFGPFGPRSSNYDLGCSEAAGQGEVHELGECPLWQVLRIGQLTPSFTKALLHPQHVIEFNSCDLNDERTGNSLLVHFSDAAGTDMTEALTLAGIPNAGSYQAAWSALGL